MSKYSELAGTLDTTADEIASRGINGWGNACSDAAAALRELEAERDGLRDLLERTAAQFKAMPYATWTPLMHDIHAALEPKP